MNKFGSLTLVLTLAVCSGCATTKVLYSGVLRPLNEISIIRTIEPENSGINWIYSHGIYAVDGKIIKSTWDLAATNEIHLLSGKHAITYEVTANSGGPVIVYIRPTFYIETQQGGIYIFKGDHKKNGGGKHAHKFWMEDSDKNLISGPLYYNSPDNGQGFSKTPPSPNPFNN